MIGAKVYAGTHALSAKDVPHGIQVRRGNGLFGELIPGQPKVHKSDSSIPFGALAPFEVGIEAKIMATGQRKNVESRITDLNGQLAAPQKGAGGGPAISVGTYGVNHAPWYFVYEGLKGGSPRVTATDGKKHSHPIQEALVAKKLLSTKVTGYESLMADLRDIIEE